ncbi:MAG: ROK family protein [Microbacteriaceae bacterium]|nr:MAG: ROK family protein [Microbacteriaceae bacterium]
MASPSGSTRNTRSTPTTTPGGVLALFRSGTVSSRADVARHTGLSASTAAIRIDELVRHGFLREDGEGASHGGRRPRNLTLSAGSGFIVAVDLGAHHATFGLLDMTGALLADDQYPLDIALGAETVLRWVLQRGLEFAAAHGHAPEQLRGFGIGMPGPVDSRVGALISPSRMPGWNGVNAAVLLAELSGVPVTVDNDANLMALGEYVTTGDAPDHMVFVKAGSSIGCGVISGGALHHGHTGIAGDISHVAVADAPAVVCSCGRTGCLDAVAGGAAIVRDLAEAGVDVGDIAGVLALASDASPLATGLLRTAGRRTGAVLATIVNFFNPQRLVLGGQLCQAEAFVAGVRSAIYTECLPMATDQLEIAVSRSGQLGGVLGAGRAILDHLFDPEVIDRAIRSRTQAPAG